MPVAALIVLATAAPAAAASLTLTDAQKRDALRVGERSITQETFGGEWRVRGANGETATVVTPFHRVALAGRNAAFEQKAVKPAEIERLLREQAARLILWVTVRGPKEDFARYYAPRLVVGDREIKATFVQNERTAARQDDGEYLARCVYGFPTRDLTATTRATLVVADADGKDVTRFSVDLGAMR
ncbi:MAG: hypothetical protein ACRELS_20945 [Candidatus Rokuibacteriota bacterium]